MSLYIKIELVTEGGKTMSEFFLGKIENKLTDEEGLRVKNLINAQIDEYCKEEIKEDE
jgi:hypothetical protein